MCSPLDHVYRLLKTRSLKALGDIMKVAQDAAVNHHICRKLREWEFFHLGHKICMHPRASCLYASSAREWSTRKQTQRDEDLNYPCSSVISSSGDIFHTCINIKHIIMHRASESLGLVKMLGVLRRKVSIVSPQPKTGQRGRQPGCVHPKLFPDHCLPEH
jgi:hypothetical protein